MASTMIGGALALALASGPAFAQTTTPNPTAGQQGTQENQQTPFGAVEGTSQDAEQTGADGDANEVGEVVVTGSRIPQPNLTSVSPVTVIGSQEVQLSGITRSEDLINQLPQAFASQGSALANGATGTATVDLRSLGANRTLVLIDGRRLMPGAPAGGAQSSSAPDLNFIPAALIDRVEVVTGGASAVYGADAVAGVVNFIMQRNFTGFRIDAQYSFYQHENSNDVGRLTVERRLAGGADPRQFTLPDENVDDGYGRDITLVFGASTDDGRGNVTAYAGYRNIDSITQDQRDYSACTLQGTNAAAAANTGFQCGGSGTTGPGGQFLPGGGTVAGLTLDPAAPGGRGFRPYVGARDAFNFAPYNYYQRPDERYTLGAFAHYEINPSADVYGQFMFMDDRTVAQIAPSGIFLQTINVNCGSPLLSASQVTALCGPTIDQDPATDGLQNDASASTPGQQAAVAIGRRNLEGGGRQADIRHTDYRIVAGVRGDLGENWRYDAYGQYGTVIYNLNYLNDFSLVRSARALDVVAGAGGAPVCRSVVDGSDPACVPYDIFSIAGPSQASLDYLQTPGFQDGTTRQSVVSATIAGDLGDYGIRSPWATDGAGIALGTEYRREELDLRVDNSFATGDLAGQGGATLGVAGDFDLYEIFGEIRVPLVQDVPFFQEVTLEAGYRFSDYSLGFDTDTYKIGGDWRPIEDVRFRASFNRAVRAPNIIELFNAQNVVLNGTTDPCEGSTPEFTLAQCQRTGVSAAQYGRIVENPAAQFNGLTGGNPDLRPETSDTTAFGVAFTPRFLPGFNLTVDYYNITVEDRIGQIGQDVTIQRCGETGDPFYCALIRRSPGTGSLFLGNNGFVIDTNLNTGSLEVTGIDVEANYRFDFDDFGFTSALADFGGLSFNYVAGFLDEYLVETLPGDETFNCAGQFGNVCTGTAVPSAAPLAEYKHKLRVSWRTPWNLQPSLSWRHVSSVENDNQTFVDRELDSQNYFDLAATWRVFDGVTFRGGVNNIFDNDPPLVAQQNCPAGPCNGNTFPQTYDANGRYLFLGVSADF